MHIVNSPRFQVELESIVEFIAEESPQNALNFLDRLIEHLRQIQEHPYSGRLRKNRSPYPVRELIHEGYTIPYMIDHQEKRIVLLGIFNRNLWNES